MAANTRTSLSDKIILLCFFFAFLFTCVYRNHDNMVGVIWSDTEGYYMYLPAVFITKDIHKVQERSMNFRRNEKGEIVMKYTCGVAFFYLPFFAGAHIVAKTLGYPADGFSPPYLYAMILCGVFWSFIGVFFLQRILSKYFSRIVTWLTVVCIILGTNFYYYSTKWMGMSHLYSFTLIAALLVLTDKYYEKPQRKTAIFIGLLLGWLVLIRPTNILAIVFLLLYRVASTQDLKSRISLLKNNARDILVAIPFFMIPFVPQLLYWKEMTGKWITYSYEGESFSNWNHPQIAAVLFDTQNGLFLYAPILLFMFAGMAFALKDKRTNSLATLTVFILITYVFASWWYWWFGAAYGHRCYIEYLPFFAFPIAVAIEKILKLKANFKIPALAVMTVFIYYNIGLTFVNDRNGIWDGPQWRWNWDLWWSMVRQTL